MCCVLRDFCVSLSLDGSTSWLSPSPHFVEISASLYLSSTTPPVISSSVNDRMKDSAFLSSDSSSLSVDSASVSVESSSLSLSLLDDSASLSRSPRRIHVSLGLLDDSASLSVSSTTPRLSHSPRLLASLKNHSTSLSGPWLSSTKSNGKIMSLYGRIKRHECSSKKRTVVLTDQEIMAISDGRIKRHEDSSKKRTVVLTDQEIMAISVSGTN
ncbi:hypothetical protein F2Q70_00039797 [Brassica cretica]|uniref:Uncharacterized protein n=1 Tax=Brassica cretica TaxID=69181 RepID=A0A8S9K5X6_BRACR|nr:hypothetical protein F2Q70_00039797 [Brassica cretica]